MDLVLIGAGLLALLAGGQWLVSGAAALALRLGVPAFVIGATVVGFGTSLPELMVSVLAALDGAAGIAIGNVVGSNIANLLLILGLSALIGPLAARLAEIRGDLAWMVLSAAACVPAFAGGTVGRLEGAALVAALAVYLTITLRRGGGTGPGGEIAEAARALGLARPVLSLLGGLALVLLGARWLVTGASRLAADFGVSEAVIGLTVVAVGTSLPELVTSVVAAWRGEREIALGNVIGSNIFNVLGILGVTALIAPIPVADRFLAADVPVMIAVSVAVAATVALYAGLTRATGMGCVVAYAAYVGLLAV